ncbi:DegT/DnrJ/EryC1/StrS family aminotransferase [Novacetimonas hansenii]|uniref:Aminotransferase DegT n=2 Tax=Novacetimonas hansenii TaxID=436 RepID=A0AAW5ENI1_NOVHA|nr:DegT/DnrJ/EryC1/StrS family aminotransferase [Novacetimonas hansenii]EFG84985.1 putative aminotransferase protein [Novacetimonas hansenii ATCC 23769]MCJ8352408.1 DegT/DnrJ/EryC1/StrS family aminotransferase [Novacetimonas hansenii]PYD73584.1 DegT/DnrJ/EryC1/StrS family aminotransferase [Novacetimonas hansenii]RFP03506.1 aminotransferase DegT [Novacetimonas hansenii]WEQ60000.1 DegT/DnrJ/EryC1/StrS family aminotransferase [Novacetimonas hansenii]
MTSPAEKPIGFLDLARQQDEIGPNLRARIDAVMTHCRFVMGPEVSELEERLAAYAGAAACVGVSSGTDAIQIVLMAEGVGAGDAVFLPAFTYTATAEVPLVLGATPVFVDVDPHTFQIDPASLRARIADVRAQGRLRPRAIIGVDLFGQPAPWPELRAIAAEQDMYLMADCAQSFGASLSGRKLGREAAATTLSFFPSKPLGAYGDAGAILTDDPERAELYRSLRSHGEGKTRYEVLRTGMNARLDTLQAAVLLAKMECFDADLRRRRDIASAYDAGIAQRVVPPARVPDSESAWAIYSVLTRDAQDRAALQEQMKARNVASAVYYPLPLHLQPAYQPHHDGVSLPVAEDLSRRILALPLHPQLTDHDVGRVVAAICGAAGG